MHYKFPILQTIDDVLPHIAGREEFIVADKGDYTVINYVVAMADTFNMTGPDDLGGAVRRECRGLIFNKQNRLISRPYHKFFNIGEREETQPHLVDLDLLFDHVIMEKMDGSMIRPLVLQYPTEVDIFLNHYNVQLATKMGVTDIGRQSHCAMNQEKEKWLFEQFNKQKTPLLEYVSPRNQIVVSYAKDNLVLTGMRDNLTGEYTLPTDSPFDMVPTYGAFNGTIFKDLDAYIAHSRTRTDCEGDIVRFWNGHMLKNKNDWYVRLHKVVDRIQTTRHIVDIVLNEEMDDLLPKLPPHQRERVENYTQKFWAAFQAMENRMSDTLIEVTDKYANNRKRIALEWVPAVQDKQYASFIFSMMGGRAPRDILLAHVRKHLFTNTKWAECEAWLGIVE